MTPREVIHETRADGRQRDVRCPAHDDHRASLSVGRGDDGRVLLHCHAGCSIEAILAAGGLTITDIRPETTTAARRIVATYRYEDERGTHLYDVIRYAPKDFRQRRADGTWSMVGVRRVLYRLPQLVGHDTVYVAEGERDVDALAAVGLAATCNPGGAGKWRAEYAAMLRQAGCQRVVVLPDADEAGRQHAAQVASSCHLAGLTVRVLTLPGLPAKGDVSDWLAAGGTVEALQALAEGGAVWTPPTTVDAVASGVVIPAPDLAAEAEERIRDEMARQRTQREARRRLDAEDRGPVPTPEIVTLASLLDEPDPAVTWRIADWQPTETRVMLAATRKSGKTTLVGSLVRSLVDGDAWLARDTVVPLAGAVAIIDTEMSRGQLRAWLRAQRIQHTDRVVLVPLRGQAATLDLLDRACLMRWASWLRARDVRYLILDCLRPVLDAIGLDESREAGRYLVALDALLREADIPEACIVHHMGHAGERARGDSRLRDWPDVEWRLVREDADDDASARYLAAYGRDVEQAEARLEYDPLTRRITVAGGTRREAAVSTALDEVVAVLREAGEALTSRALEAACLDAGMMGRAQIRAAVAHGIGTGAIVVRSGPRRARLHECATVPECAAHAGTVDESSAPVCRLPIGRRTGTLTEVPHVRY